MKWEYGKLIIDGRSGEIEYTYTDTAGHSASFESEIEVLTTLGNNRWELVTSTSIGGVETLRFKRPRRGER